MAIKNQAITISFVVWDTINNLPKTGDNANLTLRLIKDGTAAAPTNSSSEVDATNAPGIYKISLTADEMNYSTVTLAGKSSTSGVVVMPVHMLTELGTIAIIDGIVDTILTDTNELQTDWTNGGRLDLLLDAIPTATANADALLKRDWTSVTGEAARSCLNAFRILRNARSVSGSTLSIKKEDDSTDAWTASVSTSASAETILGVDPS